MQPDKQIDMVREIMMQFAEQTGLVGTGITPKRYLWTDAFAVCNFLELFRQTDDRQYEDLARRLVDQVHHVLGRHRSDDDREGWLSCLNQTEGEDHPTQGGLRIGKALPERQLDEPFDEQLEWDRDGQYYHYLTKWMLALNRFAMKTNEGQFNRWALELARSAHAGFTCQTSNGGRPRMHWKMSIDLSRPLVAAMGHHDPLDGFLTFHELQEQSTDDSAQGKPGFLASEIRDLERMCDGVDWLTDDPLGLGGILSDALRATRLIIFNEGLQLHGLLSVLLEAGSRGLSFYAGGSSLQYPADYRLAFRELGLAIGLHAAERMDGIFKERSGLFAGQDQIATRLREILSYMPLCKNIEDFWLSTENQQAATWVEHQNINMVMLATSLAPDGYFGISEEL